MLPPHAHLRFEHERQKSRQNAHPKMSSGKTAERKEGEAFRESSSSPSSSSISIPRAFPVGNGIIISNSAEGRSSIMFNILHVRFQSLSVTHPRRKTALVSFEASLPALRLGCRDQYGAFKGPYNFVTFLVRFVLLLLLFLSLCLAVRNNSSMRGGRERSGVEKPFFPSFPFYCGTLLSYEAREGRGDMGSVQWAGPSHRRSCVPEFPGLLRGPPPSPMTERRALPFSSLFTHDVGCVGAV